MAVEGARPSVEQLRLRRPRAQRLRFMDAEVAGVKVGRDPFGPWILVRPLFI